MPQISEAQVKLEKENFRINEPVLIIALCKKDEIAFCFLYDKYAPVLYGIILATVKTEEVANAVLQDVFCCIWRTIDHFDQKSALLTWLLRTANRQALKRNNIQEKLITEIV